MLLVFMIFMKELTNQILLPGFRAVLTVHSQVNGGVYILLAIKERRLSRPFNPLRTGGAHVSLR